jgi:hypothetical protein
MDEIPADMIPPTQVDEPINLPAGSQRNHVDLQVSQLPEALSERTLHLNRRA